MSVARRSVAARAVVRVAVLAAVLGGAHPAISLTASGDLPQDSVAQVAVDDVETELTTVDVPEQAPEESPQHGDETVVAGLENTRTQDFGLVGVTWELGTAAEDLVVEIRTRTDETWTAWEGLDR